LEGEAQTNGARAQKRHVLVAGKTVKDRGKGRKSEEGKRREVRD
jgi:hypothetical protein